MPSPRCLELHHEAGQCQLQSPHTDKPHAAVTSDGVLLWNHLEMHRWPAYELPNWIRRLPWVPEYAPPQPDDY
jgi:hypothetical protein